MSLDVWRSIKSSFFIALAALAQAVLISASVPAAAASSGIPCGCFGDPITFCVPCATTVTSPVPGPSA
ncbi:hypothetical protein B0H11DRAFT_2225563 [Mycena galericulata]|nr:hypothetical protein B0H11DRAFT_2225563 [Mycena galericulata]